VTSSSDVEEDVHNLEMSHSDDSSSTGSESLLANLEAPGANGPVDDNYQQDQVCANDESSDDESGNAIEQFNHENVTDDFDYNQMGELERMLANDE